MKILQVATLVTPDGAYGGPIRVAVNQTRALLDAGHEVVLMAGAQGFSDVLPDQFDGVPIRLFPGRQLVPGLGFATTIAPQLFAQMRRTASYFDIIHVHLARDLVTLPVAKWAQSQGLPYVVQTHGMIAPSRNLLSHPLDFFWTRSVLSSAGSVLYLTDDELKNLWGVAGSAPRYRRLINGVPVQPLTLETEALSTEVLFLARLHPRKRPLMFIEMARVLGQEFSDASFRLVGPDEGEGAACRAAIDRYKQEVSLEWEGPIAPEQTSSRLSQASIYVLPSIDEPFPMSVLEAMAVGKPVIVTKTCGLASAIERAGAGLVVDHSASSLVSAVRSLLSNGPERQDMGQRAQSLASELFTMENVVNELESSYLATTTEAPRFHQ